MHCVVTAGPTYETMDNVRRLTNFSTGQLGVELANFLTHRGCRVTLLLGEQATYCGERSVDCIRRFATTEDLLTKIHSLADQNVGAVFHAAAVSDFRFGKIWQRSPSGELTELHSGKLSTRAGTLLAELVPTPKVIAELRTIFPRAKLVGWKYEVDGDRASVIAAAEKQLRDCHTNACVVNGAAYGAGFGVVNTSGQQEHAANREELFGMLQRLLEV